MLQLILTFHLVKWYATPAHKGNSSARQLSVSNKDRSGARGINMMATCTIVLHDRLS